MQVAITQDYATDSWFWTIFTGEIINVLANNLVAVRLIRSGVRFFMPQFPFRSLFADFAFKNDMHVNGHHRY